MIKQTLLGGWHFMRWFRLGIGIAIAIQAIRMNDAISGVIAFFFLFQAATNTGCCGGNACEMPPRKQTSTSSDEIEFEEVQTSPK